MNLLEKTNTRLSIIIWKGRKQKKLSQSQLAEILGVNRKQVVRWESGRTFPTYQNLVKLSDELGFDLKKDI